MNEFRDTLRVAPLRRRGAEIRPPAFAISDTAFPIFSVMAGRRFKSDRFSLTVTRPSLHASGIGRVEENGMREIVLRHAPALAGALSNFRPWSKAGS